MHLSDFYSVFCVRGDACSLPVIHACLRPVAIDIVVILVDDCARRTVRATAVHCSGIKSVIRSNFSHITAFAATDADTSVV